MSETNKKIMDYVEEETFKFKKGKKRRRKTRKEGEYDHFDEITKDKLNSKTYRWVCSKLGIDVDEKYRKQQEEKNKEW